MMVPLVVKSHYSLMWGTASLARLCGQAKALGYDRLALTDTDNLYGLWWFLKACKRSGLRPIVGAEITSPKGRGRAVCLVKDRQGFGNLCRLISARKRDSDFSLKSALPGFGQGLLVLAFDAAHLRHWHALGLDLAAALPQKLKGATWQLRKTARELAVPLAAVPDSCFLHPEEYQLHRVLRAIDLNTSLSRLKPQDVATSDAWLASPEEYARRFETMPQAITNTAELAARLDYLSEPGLVMPPWQDAKGLSAAEVLRQKAYAGARKRYGRKLPKEVQKRLEHELGIIREKNFSSYFLVVQKIVRLSPRICGRGSGAASLVAYSLGITNVCPIKFNLYFERFINPQRVDPPDIDVDFAWDERDAVLDKVLERYAGRSAMVATHVLFQGKMAIREVAKVYGLPQGEIKRFMKKLPWLRGPAESETGMYPRRKALPKGAGLDYPDPWPQILLTAQHLVGTPRHISVHVGGVVITPGPIDRYAPIETAAKGVPIVQWEKDGTEDAGLVKIDLLGNRSLGVIRDAIADLKRGGGELDEAVWEPEDDEITQKMVAKGDTMGCFYVESPATRLLQQKAGRGDYEHMVIHSSIIRPAANDYIQEYLRRLHGGSWKHIHPLLAGILDETYGIMVYQEQVSQAAVALAGFSHAQGDGLRKVMTKKDKARALRDYRQKFVKGALQRGVGPEQIEDIWRMMLSFSGYSFCKPHSASYARVSFQAAFLKAHFPAQFMAAVISNQGGFYSTFAYVSEARRLGLTILPPDVQKSRIRWSGQGDEVRVGLMALKDLGKRSKRRIIAEQESGRPFAGVGDFLKRVRPDEREARALIHAGALDGLPGAGSRAGQLWRLAKEPDRRPAGFAAHLPGSLFDADPERVAASPPPLPPEPELERLRREFKVLGFLTSRHPMQLFENKLSGRCLVKAAEVPGYVGQRIHLAGWLITGKTVLTAKHDPMQFLTFEDETGIVETTFFPQAYRRFYLMLDWERPYVLYGLVEENYQAVTLTVSGLEAVRGV
jgi:error-prone DNA polymerase